ncbi:unnamed protein product, partial [Iphiclides podalirius]
MKESDYGQAYARQLKLTKHGRAGLQLAAVALMGRLGSGVEEQYFRVSSTECIVGRGVVYVSIGAQARLRPVEAGGGRVAHALALTPSDEAVWHYHQPAPVRAYGHSRGRNIELGTGRGVGWLFYPYRRRSRVATTQIVGRGVVYVSIGAQARLRPVEAGGGRVAHALALTPSDEAVLPTNTRCVLNGRSKGVFYWMRHLGAYGHSRGRNIELGTGRGVGWLFYPYRRRSRIATTQVGRDRDAHAPATDPLPDGPILNYPQPPSIRESSEYWEGNSNEQRKESDYGQAYARQLKITT